MIGIFINHFSCYALMGTTSENAIILGHCHDITEFPPAAYHAEKGGMVMATISLCMIVRDEEAVLGRCLESVKDAVDEIIIVDTGSTDRTKEIAEQYTSQLFTFQWVDNFAAARNFTFSKARMDYQMWLDADDVLMPEDAAALRTLKEELKADVVMMPYQVAFDSDGHPTMSYYRERLFKREKGFQWAGAVHETITPSGEIRYVDIAVQHRKLHINDPDRNLRILERQKRSGKLFSARDMYYYARELYYHERYNDAAKAFTDFLTMPDGWVEDKIGACLQMAKCCEMLGKPDAAMLSLCQSFAYGRPRAEICCEMGRLLMEREKYEEAIFWYKTAADVPLSEGQGGFSEPDSHDYIPFIQLCVCYDRIGNHQTARAYNDKAGRIKPKNAAYLANRRYFQELETGN